MDSERLRRDTALRELKDRLGLGGASSSAAPGAASYFDLYLSRYIRATAANSASEAARLLLRRRHLEHSLASLTVTPLCVLALRSGAFSVITNGEVHCRPVLHIRPALLPAACRAAYSGASFDATLGSVCGGGATPASGRSHAATQGTHELELLALMVLEHMSRLAAEPAFKLQRSGSGGSDGTGNDRPMNVFSPTAADPAGGAPYPTATAATIYAHAGEFCVFIEATSPTDAWVLQSGGLGALHQVLTVLAGRYYPGSVAAIWVLPPAASPIQRRTIELGADLPSLRILRSEQELLSFLDASAIPARIGGRAAPDGTDVATIAAITSEAARAHQEASRGRLGGLGGSRKRGSAADAEADGVSGLADAATATILRATIGLSPASFATRVLRHWSLCCTMLSDEARLADSQQTRAEAAAGGRSVAATTTAGADPMSSVYNSAAARVGRPLWVPLAWASLAAADLLAHAVTVIDGSGDFGAAVGRRLGGGLRPPPPPSRAGSSAVPGGLVGSRAGGVMRGGSLGAGDFYSTAGEESDAGTAASAAASSVFIGRRGFGGDAGGGPTKRGISAPVGTRNHHHHNGGWSETERGAYSDDDGRCSALSEAETRSMRLHHQLMALKDSPGLGPAAAPPAGAGGSSADAAAISALLEASATGTGLASPLSTIGGHHYHGSGEAPSALSPGGGGVGAVNSSSGAAAAAAGGNSAASAPYGFSAAALARQLSAEIRRRDEAETLVRRLRLGTPVEDADAAVFASLRSCHEEVNVLVAEIAASARELCASQTGAAGAHQRRHRHHHHHQHRSQRPEYDGASVDVAGVDGTGGDAADAGLPLQDTGLVTVASLFDAMERALAAAVAHAEVAAVDPTAAGTAGGNNAIAAASGQTMPLPPFVMRATETVNRPVLARLDDKSGGCVIM